MHQRNESLGCQGFQQRRRTVEIFGGVDEGVLETDRAMISEKFQKIRTFVTNCRNQARAARRPDGGARERRKGKAGLRLAISFERISGKFVGRREVMTPRLSRRGRSRRSIR